MDTLFQQILNLLIQPPGNVIYHLVLAFSVISGLQAVLIARQASSYPHAGRMIFGLTMLLLGQAVLFFSSGLAWQGVLDEHLFLPPLDRAVVLFSMIWIVWLWNFPAPARLGDLVTGFLNLGVVLLFLFTYTSWSAEGAGATFNHTWMDWTWELAALFVVLTGMALLIFTRPAGWAYGVGMLSLGLAGFVGHLVMAPMQGNFSGIIRLGQLAAFPLLPTLLNRLNVPARKTAPASQPAPAPVPYARSQERRRYSTDPRTVHAWLEMNHTTQPDKVLSGLSKALAHTMLSDLCFLVTGPNYGHLILQSGYDLIREEEMEGTMLEQSQVPALSNATQRGKTLRVTNVDSQPPDLKSLSAALGLSETGSLLFIPLLNGEKPVGGVLFLSPYSSRQWTAEDQTYLASELDLIAQIFLKAQQQAENQQLAGSSVGLSAGAERASEELRRELETLRQENQKLLNELHLIQQGNGRAGDHLAPNTDLNALVALQQEAQEQIANLQAENERLQSALRGQGITVLSPDEFKRMESELRATLQEIALLQNQLAEANARNLLLERDLQQTDKTSSGTVDQEVLASIAQEFRQPLSSILGYTDLLLAESVGILGAMQRKFLERIKASTERMRSMLDDLIRVTTLSSGTIELSNEPIEFPTIVDNAVSVTSAQLREKDIALRVDLPQHMPQIHADREAIQQVIIHLLQNAGAATPQEGTITLRARVQKEKSEEYLWLQVTDTGGGIDPAGLQQVFAQRYQAEQPLIQGLGDTSVGLSIVKSLVEAHGGRIWADSVVGESTTFSVLMPIRQSSLEEA